MSATDITFMQRALELARGNLGQTWPNPSVGATVVKDGKIIAEGNTQRGGRPHAETVALAQAGANARGATLYVSLQPCAHFGKTPPCTQAIIDAGIAHVVIACRDPNPVAGHGEKILSDAGIKITFGVCEQEALALNCGFFSAIQKKRPYVALKIATSSDGKIAGGKTKWITGDASRERVHQLRSEHDAILTGIGTVLADDPLLTVRIPGLEHKSPVRVVLDRHHRMPPQSQLAQTIELSPLWVLSSKTLPEALAQLAEKGITRLLVEAGQKLNTAFLQEDLADSVYWFQAPNPIGPGGLDALESGPLTLDKSKWRLKESTAFAPDTLQHWERS